MPDYFDETVMDEYEELWADHPNYKIRCNSDLLPLFIEKPMMYSKGEKFQYNNTGYVLLAMIIEKITEMSFDHYLKANIFDVCGMKATGYYELDRLPAKCANNYIYCAETKTYRTNIYSVDVKVNGAGGAFISVKDITKFWKGLLEGKLISKELLSQMLSKQSGNGIMSVLVSNYGDNVWKEMRKIREKLY